MKFNRVWAMPSSETFSIPPIGSFVRGYLSNSVLSIDPFARNSQLATVTNDLNPETKAQYHLDALEFLGTLRASAERFDLAIFDPPYSSRQISECYNQVGRTVTGRDTQGTLLYRHARHALLDVLTEDALVLSFGWNSSGMGRKCGFEII